MPGNFGGSTGFLCFCPSPHRLTSASRLHSARIWAVSAFGFFSVTKVHERQAHLPPRHIYRNLKLPPGAFSPGSGFPRWNLCMPTPDHFTLGLLPERRMDWGTLATSYGFEILVIILLINVGFIWPERLQLAQNYRVTEIIP